MKRMESGEKGLSIWLSGEDIPARDAELCRLVQSLRDQAGLDPWPEIEADCFRAGEELLILARPAPPRTRGFWFADLDSLLGAVSSCRMEGTALYALEGGYLLTVPPEEACLALYEFGSERPLPRDWEAHAREQKQCLLPTDAAGKLVRCFSTDSL